MAIIATEGDVKSYAPAPAGVNQAVCVDVIDKGIVEVTYPGQPAKKQHKVTVAWQLAELRDDGKRFLVFKRYTLSLNEKATLRKDLESWRGRAFTESELKGFDVETVIGCNALINVQHNTVAGRTYANVVSIMPLVRGMTKMGPHDYVREQDRTPDDGNSNGSEQHERDLTADDIPF